MLIQVVVTLVIVGFLLWLVNRFIPMQSNIKSISPMESWSSW